MKAVYVKTTPKCIVNISKIVTILYYEFDRSFVFKGEAHDFWEMVYVDKGQVLVQRDEEEIALSQGEVIFHRPNEFHAIRALDSAPNFFVISFVCESGVMKHLEKYRAVLNKTLRTFISSILKEAGDTYDIPKNNTAFRKLKKRENAPIGGEQLIKTYLEQLLIFLVRGILQEENAGFFFSRESMDNHFVVAIKAWVKEQVEAPFRMESLCASLGYSKGYLSRIFREQTGETIGAYFTAQKIRRAKDLIREGHLNFAQISDRLSFENSRYFSRVFKRITGMTPTEFKCSLVK